MNNRLVWSTGRRKKILEVPDKEGKQISQSSPALQMGPRQTLFTAVCGIEVGQMKGPEQRCHSHLWLPIWLLLPSVTKPSLLMDPRPSLQPSVGACYSSFRPWAVMALYASLGPESGPKHCGQRPVSDVVWGHECSLEVCFGPDHSIRDDLTHWAWACFELHCIADTCKTNLGTHKCVTNYFAPLQSVY